MQGYTRRQLKEDRFAETAKDAADWASGHRLTVLWAVAIVVLVAAAVGGFVAWQSRQNEQANIALSAAMRTFSQPLRPAGAPPTPGEDAGFTSSIERAKAAAGQFQSIADKYSLTKAGKVARYMQGVASMQAGDNATAEKLLKDVAGSRDKDLAALAGMALGSLYRSTGRQSDAVRIYKEIEGNPTNTVSKADAQLAMASLYESTDPQQANTIYQAIMKESPTSTAAQIANSRLNGGKSPATLPQE